MHHCCFRVLYNNEIGNEILQVRFATAASVFRLETSRAGLPASDTPDWEVSQPQASGSAIAADGAATAAAAWLAARDGSEARVYRPALPEVMTWRFADGKS